MVWQTLCLENDLMRAGGEDSPGVQPISEAYSLSHCCQFSWVAFRPFQYQVSFPFTSLWQLWFLHPCRNTDTYLSLGTQLDEVTLGVRVARGRAPPHLPGDGGVGDGEAELRHQEREQEDEDGVGASVTVVWPALLAVVVNPVDNQGLQKCYCQWNKPVPGSKISQFTNQRWFDLGFDDKSRAPAPR